jgi:hypothetical protein
VVQEFDEGKGAMTITVQDEANVRGLQIFILPYEGDTISEERFRADVPSGTRENVEPAMLGGVEAVTFTSQDPFLGKTREIWLIHDGHLFEITTFRGTSDWFLPILQTWKFL